MTARRAIRDALIGTGIPGVVWYAMGANLARSGPYPTPYAAMKAFLLRTGDLPDDFVCWPEPEPDVDEDAVDGVDGVDEDADDTAEARRRLYALVEADKATPLMDVVKKLEKRLDDHARWRAEVRLRLSIVDRKLNKTDALVDRLVPRRGIPRALRGDLTPDPGVEGADVIAYTLTGTMSLPSQHVLESRLRVATRDDDTPWLWTLREKEPAAARRPLSDWDYDELLLRGSVRDEVDAVCWVVEGVLP